MADLPQEWIRVTAAAIHDETCPGPCTPAANIKHQRAAIAALKVVAPLIAAAEQEKAVRLATRCRAVYCKPCNGAPCDYTDELAPFADLIRSGTQEAEPSSP